MTKLRNTCLFALVVFIIAPAVFLGFYSFFADTILSGILTALIVVPLFFIEGILKLYLNRNRLREIKFLICPRCKTSVEKEPGICPNCGIQL